MFCMVFYLSKGTYTLLSSNEVVVHVSNVAFALLLTVHVCPQGLRRSEQSNILEIYRAKMPVSAAAGSTHSDTNQNSALQTQNSEQESSRIRKLERLIKKRL